MLRTGKKKYCPGCNVYISGGSHHLLNHMKRTYKCSQHIVYCVGCNKAFSGHNHLKNHQKSQQSIDPNTSCIQGIAKLDRVQTLTLDSNVFDPKVNNQVFTVEQECIFTQDTIFDEVQNNKKPKLSNKLINTTTNMSSTPISSSSLPSQVKQPILTHSVLHNHPVTMKEQSLKIIQENTLPQFMNNLPSSQPSTTNNNKSTVPTSVQPNSIIKDTTCKTVPNFVGKTLSQNDTLMYICDDNDDNQYNDLFSSNKVNNVHSKEQDISTKNLESSIYEQLLVDFDADTINSVNSDNNNEFPDDNEQQNLSFTQESDNSSNSINSSTSNIDQTNNIQYILDRIKHIKSHRSQTTFSYIEIALLNLSKILTKSGAPVHLFDQIISWVLDNGSTLFESPNGDPVIPKQRIPTRRTFVSKIYDKVHSKQYVDIVRPKIVSIPINPTMATFSTIFDFNEVLVDMLMNDDIMSNLLFYDNDNPTSIHPGSSDVGEIITSDVFLNASKRLCKKQNDVLFPLIMYSDEINVDTYSKLKLDPLSISFGRLPLHIRNQSKAWRYLGFITSLKASETDQKMTAKLKQEIYHKCLFQMVKKLQEIQKEGGIPFKLKMKNGNYHNVNLILYLQFIIGDTKGHDNLCCRMGSYSLGMEQLIRDCNVKPDESDEVFHICKFRTINEVRKLKEMNKCQEISFNNTINAFDGIDMGDKVHGIYGATCGEPLHIMEMQLLELMSGCFCDSLCASSLEVLRQTIVSVVSITESDDFRKEYFTLSPFREGIMSVKNLTGKERHARIFAIFLALMSSDCCMNIMEKPKKNGSLDCSYGKPLLQQWLTLLEDSLILMKWIRKPTHPRKYLYNPNYLNSHQHDSNDPIKVKEDDLMSLDSKAQKAVLSYLSNYKNLVVRNRGNELKIPKFHSMLHLVRNIIRHGSVPNYDGSRPEAIAKELAKAPAKRTQKHHKSISYQTAMKYHQDITFSEALRLHNNCIPIVTDYSYFNRTEVKPPITNGFKFGGSSFSLKIQFRKHNVSSKFDEILQEYGETIEAIVSRVVWNGKCSFHRLDDNLLYCITNWLWVNKIGGTISKTSMPIFYTELKIKGKIVRCHPNYRSKKTNSLDWVLVDWGEGYPEPLPARVMMLIDTSNCEIIPEEQCNDNSFVATSSNDVGARLYPLPKHEQESHHEATFYLSHHTKWAVIQSAVDDGFTEQNQYSRYQLKSKIAKRINLEKNKYRIIPVSDIVERIFGLCDYIPINKSRKRDYDDSAIIIDPSSTWADHFYSM